MTDLTTQFAIANHYAITLPNSQVLPYLLEDIVIDRFNTESKEQLIHPYTLFVNEVRKAIETFLEENNELSCVFLDSINDIFSDNRAASLHMTVTDQGMNRLMKSLDTLLAEMHLKEDIVDSGLRWNRLPYTKLPEISWGNF